MSVGFGNSLGLPTTLGVNDGGTGVDSFSVPYGVLCAGTTGTGNLQTVAALGSAGQLLTSNGASALPSFQDGPSYPAGSIIQVVSGSSTSNVSLTSGTYVSTGVSATITPTSSSNHVVIIGSLNFYLTFVATDTQANMGCQLWRAGSSIVDFGNGIDFGANLVNETLFVIPSTNYYYDAPATTSATTYEFYINLSTGASGSGGINKSGQLSSIYLIEVSV